LGSKLTKTERFALPQPPFNRPATGILQGRKTKVKLNCRGNPDSIGHYLFGFLLH